MEIAIYWPDRSSEMPAVLQALPYPILEQCDKSTAMLIWSQGELFLQLDRQKLRLDWGKWWYYHYQQRYCLASQPLARALGIKGRPNLQVWDLTCGLGKDSLLMLSFGAQVVAFERHPLVAALLKNACDRGLEDRYLGKILREKFRLHSFDPLVTPTQETKPDVIYLDPMYVSKNQKAKAGLGMQFFRQMIGNEGNLEQLFDWALLQKPERIVIKRAIHAPLMNPNPKVSYRGKSTRYDMYVTSEVAD